MKLVKNMLNTKSEIWNGLNSPDVLQKRQLLM